MPSNIKGCAAFRLRTCFFVVEINHGTYNAYHTGDGGK